MNNELAKKALREIDSERNNDIEKNNTIDRKIQSINKMIELLREERKILLDQRRK